jgi:hypothetical protein
MEAAEPTTDNTTRRTLKGKITYMAHRHNDETDSTELYCLNLDPENHPGLICFMRSYLTRVCAEEAVRRNKSTEGLTLGQVSIELNDGAPFLSF